MFHRVRLATLTVSLLVVALGASAASIAATGTQSAGLGRRLVNRFFAELKHDNVAGLRKFLSPAWQIQRADGSRLTKREYLHKLPKVVSYKLRDFRTTSTRNLVVVTYQASTEELVNGKHVKSAYAPRLSVFSSTTGRWRMVAHSNFNPPA